jgi:hypothetical protein
VFVGVERVFGDGRSDTQGSAETAHVRGRRAQGTFEGESVDVVKGARYGKSQACDERNCVEEVVVVGRPKFFL